MSIVKNFNVKRLWKHSLFFVCKKIGGDGENG
jgi:hypothetical protein|nr:MAG TPA: hypothetical protein [Caudoviricetes sp.]